MKALSPLARFFALALAITALLFVGGPGAAGATPHPAELLGLKSGDGTAAQITFVNHSAETLRVYWIGFDGKRVLYKTLQGGMEYLQLTYLNHPWLITDEDDNAWAIFYADAQPRVVELTHSLLAP